MQKCGYKSGFLPFNERNHGHTIAMSGISIVYQPFQSTPSQYYQIWSLEAIRDIWRAP